jgi:hypothetical protein
VRNGKEKITERIQKCEKFYKPVRDIFLKWEMSNRGNKYLFKS